jgi:hypothetical protein
VLTFLKAHAGEDIFAYPYLPANFFLGGARNPTRFSMLFYRMHTDAQFREAIQSLEEKKVRYVVWEPRLQDKSLEWLNPLGWKFPREDELIMEPYLRQNYDAIAEIGAVRILQRKDAATERSRPASGVRE